jgi:hypothetical protein
LAVAVLMEHIGPQNNGFSPVLWFPSRIALIIFYMVSGFYMSLIYLKKYSQYENGIALFL